MAYVGTFSSPLRDMLPTQVDLPPGNGRGIHLFEVDRATGNMTAAGVEEMGTSPSCLAVNDSGGRVKGSPEQLLEQGSTMADKMEAEFADDQMHEVPTCYYEFAKRYPDKDGNLFQGFVATSADKIFESTDTKKS